MESRQIRLTRLVKAHQGLLLRICYVKLADAELARDAVQETFLKAFRALDDFRGEASERTWLIRIAVNTWNVICQGQIYPSSRSCTVRV